MFPQTTQLNNGNTKQNAQKKLKKIVFRVSLGAAGGVFATKFGYVDRGVAQIKEQYGLAAEACGFPAHSDVRIPEVTLPGGISSASITTGLANARELIHETFREYVPFYGQIMKDLAGSPGGNGALARTEGARKPTFLFDVGVVSLTVLAAAGVLTAYTYYLGPEKSKAMVRKRLAGAKAGTARAMTWADARIKRTLKWVDARAASLGLKGYLDAVRAHLSALAVHANAIASHPQVLAAQAAAVGFATQTALPGARLALQTVSAHARTAYAAAAPHVLAGVETVSLHAAAAREAVLKAVQALVEVIVAYFKR